MKQTALILALAFSALAVCQGTMTRKLSLSDASAVGRRILLVDITERKIEEKVVPHGLIECRIQLIGNVVESMRGDNPDKKFDLSTGVLGVRDWSEARKHLVDHFHAPDLGVGTPASQVGKRYIVIYMWKHTQPFFFEVSRESDKWRKELKPHVRDPDEPPL